MIRCEICGSFFKTAQGLAGHKRLRHGTHRLADQMGTALTGRELHRKTINHLSEKLADRLAEAILQRHGQEIWEAFLDDLSQHGFDLRSPGRYPKVKAIIVAAGESNLLLPLTKDIPDCLLQIGDRTLLGRGLENLRACGIYDIVVVR